MRALRQRFEKNMRRHAGIDWAVVEKKLQSSPDGLSSLWQMEQSEGEPDVIGHDPKTKQIVFCDRRFGHVFTYHNGAESYYAARGFRGRLTL